MVRLWHTSASRPDGPVMVYSLIRVTTQEGMVGLLYFVKGCFHSLTCPCSDSDGSAPFEQARGAKACLGAWCRLSITSKMCCTTCVRSCLLHRPTGSLGSPASAPSACNMADLFGSLARRTLVCSMQMCIAVHRPAWPQRAWHPGLQTRFISPVHNLGHPLQVWWQSQSHLLGA